MSRCESAGIWAVRITVDPLANGWNDQRLRSCRNSGMVIRGKAVDVTAIGRNTLGDGAGHLSLYI